MRGITHLGLCTLIAAVLAATGLPAVAGDTYYRWLDATGNAVHSDRPPPAGTNYEVVSTGSSMVRKVSSEEGAVPADADSSPDKEFEKSEAARATAQNKNPEFCKRAQENLSTLESMARIKVRGADGEYHYLSEEEKELERVKAREQITRNCE